MHPTALTQQEAHMSWMELVRWTVLARKAFYTFLTGGEAMVVAQGLAFATIEAAMYLYQSLLWQARQASVQIKLDPPLLSMNHPTSAPAASYAASDPMQHINGETY
ncbi:hypothetical protein WJX74_000014 [Apatococcus lobatus]|uniref:Uncharacterized protein n=1 Tax=Apatococcus lobatus TaxID=904363 RepID=A0AAW1QMG7_9CHLO